MKLIQKFVMVAAVVAISATVFNKPSAAADAQDSLYTRLGGYTAVSAVIDDLMERLIGDKQLGRFWEHRGEDGVEREKQLVKTFIA